TLFLTGCALLNSGPATKPVEDGKMPYPQSIYVYDFAVSPKEVPADSSAAARFDGAVDDPQTNAKREALEQKIADTLSAKLVAQLQAAGLPAVRWAGTPPKNKDAYVLEGQFLTSDDTSGQKVIGLALGGTELKVLAQLYHLDGGQKEGFTKVSVGSHGLAGKLPTAKLSPAKAAVSVNTAVGTVQDVTAKVRKGADETAATIVDLLKPKMQEQGWL
ncbi:MAG TPA: DUF4410 domain-containing protein, partial [Dongiaceae bacterium]